MLCSFKLYRLYSTFLFVLVFNGLYAQLCQGSLGDPIVNKTFGSGPNPGAALPAGITNYTYVDSICPIDGYYSIVNYTSKCFDSTWFTVKDHTGDANGYFMLVNASFAPGQFYLDTVRGLCSGVTFEFASWLINVKRPVLCFGASQIINPDITFRIERLDGTIIQTYTTGSIVATDPPQWKQYGFFFTTPTGINEVVIRMINNAPGGCGNDLGLDDITFRPCGPQVQTVIAGASSSTETLCEGTAKTYTFNGQVSSGYDNPTYQWQQAINSGAWSDITGATSVTYTHNFPSTTPVGDYSFRLLVAEAGNMGSPSCRIVSQPVIITVQPKSSLTVTNNGPVCPYSTLTLSATGNGITWIGPNNFSASGNTATINNVQSIHAGTYYATAASGSCSWQDSTIVALKPQPVITVDPSTVKSCEGDSVQLVANGGQSYQWIPANAFSKMMNDQATAIANLTTTVSVIGTNADGCTNTASAEIRVIKRPMAKAGADVSILKGTTIQLNGAATGDSITYYWTPDYAITGLQSLSPYVTPLADTAYVFHVESSIGCGIASDTVNVKIIKELFVPNAFSPNSDGINDKWVIKGLESFLNSRLKVFDRYGRQVYESRSGDWDGRSNGKELPAGTYYYLLEPGNNTKPLAGNITIFR